MRLNELGEIGLIDRIAKKIRCDGSVVKGIGDDAAVIRWKRGKYLLFTSDMIVEGIHFNLRSSTPFSIGRKALAVNVSDVAAMGGVPRYAVISIGLPGKTDLKVVDGIYSGTRSMADKFGINIVGGDTSSSEKMIIDIAVIGEVKERELVLRSGARPGEMIALTGRIGGSIKGRHLSFIPRLPESRFLVRNFRISSMIDLSDGLSLDLARISASSSVGARIYESLIPFSKEAGSTRDALNGGEDFELLFTVPKEILRGLVKRFKRRFKTPITAIGEVAAKAKGLTIVDRCGRVLPLDEKGFQHFRD